MRNKEYYDNPALSQSKLKLLLGDIRNFLEQTDEELYYREFKHFVIGSAVDCILTGGVFEEEFYVSTLEVKPSDKIKSIVQYVFDNIDKSAIDLVDFGNYTDTILESCNKHEYFTNLKDDTRISKVIKEGMEYFKELVNSNGKQILSSDEYSTIMEIVNSLRSNKYTSKYFNELLLSKDEEILYQTKLFFNYMSVDCKAMLDIIHINHKTKTITPIDLKTMSSSTMYFDNNVRQNRYDIQAAFYKVALIEDKEFRAKYKDYVTAPFMFIVESINVGNPLIYICTPSLIGMGLKGREKKKFYSENHELIVSQKQIKGIERLLKEYKYYIENGFDTPLDVIENNGEFLLDWEGV